LSMIGMRLLQIQLLGCSDLTRGGMERRRSYVEKG